MATLFFNSQEEAIKQLFHQEGKMHIWIWNSCIDFTFILFCIGLRMDWSRVMNVLVNIHSLISRQPFTGLVKEVKCPEITTTFDKQTDIPRTLWSTGLGIVSKVSCNLLANVLHQRFTHICLFCFYIVKLFSCFIDWLNLMCCICRKIQFSNTWDIFHRFLFPGVLDIWCTCSEWIVCTFIIMWSGLWTVCGDIVS